MSITSQESSIISADVQIPENAASARTSTNPSKKSTKSPSQQPSQITTKQSYRSRYCKFDATAIHINETRNIIPIIEPKAEKYSPIPYIFRIRPEASENRIVRTMVRCPGLHVQLDHAIAVIWSLYSSEETTIPIGINQLHWAYNFLDTIKDKQHNHPPDINHCLNSIVDDLIEQYADLTGDVHSAKSLEEFGPPDASSTPKSEDNSCVCPGGKTEAKSDSESSLASKGKDYPFSVNYNDMTLHNRTMEDKRKANERAMERIANEDNGTLLNQWRNEQFRKILSDLDELHAIEKYLNKTTGNTTSDTSSHLDEDEIQEFIARKLAEKKECSKMKNNE